MLSRRHHVPGNCQHFVTDTAGKSNLHHNHSMMYSEQIRDGSFPLLMAIHNGATSNVVETMLAHQHDYLLNETNKYGETALHLALGREDGGLDIALLLLSTSGNYLLAMAKEVRTGCLPIHVLAATATKPSPLLLSLATELLQLHPDSIFDKNGDGMTPLDVANDNEECPEELIRLLEISDHKSYQHSKKATLHSTQTVESH